jgi:hypothetical protein
MPATSVAKVYRILCSLLDVSASSRAATMSASYKGGAKKTKINLILLDVPPAVLAAGPPGTPLAKRETKLFSCLHQLQVGLEIGASATVKVTLF